MSQVPVQWVTQDELDRNRHCTSQWNGEPNMVPVVPLSALREVVEGLKVLAIHGQTEKRRALEQLCYKDDDWWSARGNHGFAQWLAQRLLASLREVGK